MHVFIEGEMLLLFIFNTRFIDGIYIYHCFYYSFIIRRVAHYPPLGAVWSPQSERARESERERERARERVPAPHTHKDHAQTFISDGIGFSE